MNHSFYAEYDGVMLKPLAEADIEQLREWRNDAGKTKFLRPISYITKEQQRKWYQNYLVQDSDIMFGIFENKELNRLVGSISFYNIDRKNAVAELGRIQIGDDEAHGRGIARKSIVMASKIGFQYLDLKKITASVHPENIASVSVFFKSGFEKYGECDSVVGGKEELIEITEDKVRRQNCYYDQINTDRSDEN